MKRLKNNEAPSRFRNNPEIRRSAPVFVLRLSVPQTPQPKESSNDSSEKHGGKITSHCGLCQADVEETLCKTLNGNDLICKGMPSWCRV
jgi:hypothetical protein